MNCVLNNLNLRRFPLTRLQFIEAMFIEHGFVSRKIITAAFGIECAMASRDMAMYSTLNGSVYFSHTTRQWQVTEAFVPIPGLLNVSAAAFLAAAGVVFGFELGEATRTKTELGVIRGYP